MLKVTIHSLSLADRCKANELGVLDIGYATKSPRANYVVALSLRRTGELEPASVIKYPRWSASLWDLVARALAQALYRDDQIPPSAKVDRRCAYATRICASIERLTAEDQGVELGTVEILQQGKRRGAYTATFTEDILGKKTAEFEYGCKALNPAELLLRAICWAYFESDTLGPKPGLILPVTMTVDGIDRFHPAALAEPAFTGFQRYLADGNLQGDAQDDLLRSEEYVRFLMQG